MKHLTSSVQAIELVTRGFPADQYVKDLIALNELLMLAYHRKFKQLLLYACDFLLTKETIMFNLPEMPMGRGRGRGKKPPKR